VWALAGSFLGWLAIPPVAWWPLAWLAPVPWLLLVQQPHLSGRRPGLSLYLGGLAFWLAAIYWVCLPHPVTCIGWAAMSSVLAVYPVLFVALARQAVQRWHVPLGLAAPVVWVGLDYVRAHFLTGFGMVFLGHTQAPWISLVQIADLGGAYAVTFVVVAVAAGLVSAVVPHTSPDNAQTLPTLTRISWKPLLAPAILLGATLAYGAWRTSGDYTRPGLRVGIIQGNVPQTLKIDPKEAGKILTDHIRLSQEAIESGEAQGGRPELLVWPETIYRYPLLVEEDPPPSTLSAEDRALWPKAVERSTGNLRTLAKHLDVPLVIGLDTQIAITTGWKLHNSALLLDPTLGLLGRYDKVHRVMFGEYIPIADAFPDLYRWTPLAGGIRSGGYGQPPLKLGPHTFAVNICFESTVPHLIRGEVARMEAAGESPDLLLNLTNDGWFWGSSEQDLHLVCSVFRAIECRRPVIVSANTGLSAWIDSDGQVRWRGPRQREATFVAPVAFDTRWSPYLHSGDFFSGICFLGTVALVFAPLRDGFLTFRAWRNRNLKA